MEGELRRIDEDIEKIEFINYVLICRICNKEFKSRTNIRNHLEEEHKVPIINRNRFIGRIWK